VGGKGSPLVTVRSFPVLPPRGPIIAYWPDRGAELPGFRFLDIAVSCVTEMHDRIFTVRSIADSISLYNVLFL
jgi:hypothetical protein